MKDYNNYKIWKSLRSTLMQDLTFSTPDDVFIYTNFKMTSPFNMDEKQILFAESFEEAAGYFRHIFLYDLLVDATDDLALDKLLRTKERQEDALFLLDLWFRAGKTLHKSDVKRALLNLTKEFNQRFNNGDEVQYEFKVLNGANGLKRFLKSKYKDNENFDAKRLDDICSNQLFAGKLLNDFIIDLFEE